MIALMRGRTSRTLSRDANATCLELLGEELREARGGEGRARSESPLSSDYSNRPEKVSGVSQRYIRVCSKKTSREPFL